VNGKKVFTDTKGKTLTDKDGQAVVNSLPLNDYVEIGIYSTKGEELHLKKHLVNQISNKLVIVVDEFPSFVAVDPLVKLLDIYTDN
jgi:ABC-2 type transport system permease protein